MSSNSSLMVVGRPGRFERQPTNTLARPGPTSPMVLQMLMQSILELNHKVDTMVTTRPQPLDVRPVPTGAIEARATQINTVENGRTKDAGPAVKVDRSRLLDIFD